MKKLLNIFIIGLALLFFTDAAVAQNNSGKITLLHTNDIHGNFLPIIIKPKNEGEKERHLGGILALEYYVSQIRRQVPHLLLFDAGDFMTGNPICDIEYEGALGGAMIRFFNLLDYDGLTLGNHEFDISVINVRNLIKIAKFPVFSANLFTAEGTLFTNEAYHIYRKAGLNIGVIGVILDDLPNYLSSPQRDEIMVKPAVSVIDSLAKLIDPQTDLLVVLSHSGIEKDKQMAAELGPEIDVIIGGHSHTRVKKAIIINDKIIVQAGSKCANLGKLDLEVKDDKVQDFQYKLIPLWNEGIKADAELSEIVAYYDDEIQKEYGRVIGELLTPWRRSHFQESNVGDFIADCIKNFSGADFAIMNSGGIRANVEAGPITKLDIKNMLPFGNFIVTFKASGKDILRLIQHNAEASAFRKHGILQVSGLRYEWHKHPDGHIEIVKATIGGKEIDEDKMYTGATIDFLIANAEKYLGIEPKQVKKLTTTLSEIVMETIEQQQKIKSKVDGRMIKR